MNNTEIVDFTGGMNTVTAPHLLALNEAVQLTNVDVKNGSLKSKTVLENSSEAQQNYFVEYKSNLYWYANWRSNALIDDKMYWSDGVNTGKIMPNGDELVLGIATPSTVATTVASGAIGAGTHKGDFKYTYTFYSTETGVESAPASLPPYVVLDEQNVDISGLDVLPAEANRYRIYRIGGYLAQFTLVATISTTTYTDSLDDTEIDGRLLQTLRSGPPPSSLANFTELNGRLYGSVENRLYFSGLGAPDSWYTDDFFNLPDTIIGVAKSQAGILVMGRSYVYLLFGAAPSSFRTKVISDYLGCVSSRSIAYYNGKVLWLGEDGIFASDGYSIQNLTYRKIEQISDLNSSSAVVANDVYYLSFKPFIIPSDELLPSSSLFPGGVRGVSVGNSHQGLVALDFKRGNGYSYEYLNYPNAISTGLYKGELYLVIDGLTTPINCSQTISCSAVFCLGDRILSKFEGNVTDPYKELMYLSPQLIDGSFSTLKEYDKVRINFIGQFNVKVIFSNTDIAVEETIESPNVITKDLELLEETDSVAIIGIPNSANKSYSIQFLIEGKGVVKSIQYSWKNRELP